MLVLRMRARSSPLQTSTRVFQCAEDEVPEESAAHHEGDVHVAVPHSPSCLAQAWCDAGVELGEGLVSGGIGESCFGVTDLVVVGLLF